MNSLDEKILRHNLKLDYPINNLKIEDQTNMLINKKINEFLRIYEKDFNNKTFIYQYNDDLISLIGYTILNIVKTINSDFNFFLYGKKKRTKKYLIKKQKFISTRKLNKLKSDEKVLIGCFNPIIKVVEQEYNSKNFDSFDYEIVKEFTPLEIFTTQKFYGIGYIKKDLIQNNNKDIIEFQKWIDTGEQKWIDGAAAQGKFEIDWENEREKIKVIQFSYSENEEENLKKMQAIEDSNDIILYFFTAPPVLLDDMNFNYVIKNPDNRLNFTNGNNLELLEEFRNRGFRNESV